MVSHKIKMLSLVMLMLLMLVATACNKGNTSASTPTSQVQSVAPSDSASAAPTVSEGPLGKYSPLITITTARAINAGVEFQDGESLDNNIWTKDFESQLGIKVINKWKVTDQQFENKVTVSMVAGDLPDFVRVNAQQLKLMVDGGQAADLSDVYNKYASDLVKQSFTASDGIALKGATFNGKLMAIPANGGENTDMQMLYIRKDWLDKLKLAPPKNMDDVVKIAKAFANNDPDGNGKKDTFGLSLDYNLWNGWSGLDGFFNGYHAYPFNPTKGSGTTLMFLKGTDGKPMLADIQPEVKTALGKLQELFKAGAINPEFSVIDGNKSADLATAGKVGMTFGASFVPGWPINDMKKNDPKVDWEVYPIPSVDDKPIMSQSMSGLATLFYVVNKKSEHPEAVIKLLNEVMEKVYGKTADEKYHVVTVGKKTYDVFGAAPIAAVLANKNVDDNDLVTAALKSGDPSTLGAQAKTYYDGVKAYQAGDLSQWFWAYTFGPNSAFDVLGKYIKNKQVLSSHYLGQPTETMISKGPTLRDLEAQVFTKIIIGAAPLDSFDTDFVAQWHKQGGDTILQEVADSGFFN